MKMTNDVIIRKLIFDLEIENEKKYFPVSNQISMNINDSFLKQLDNIFGKFKDNYYKIKSLEINIGDLNFNELVNLENIIIDHINTYLESNLLKFDIESRNINELLINYSYNGYLPWWASNKKKVNEFIKKNLKNDISLTHDILVRDFKSFKRIKEILNKSTFKLLLKTILKKNFSSFLKIVDFRNFLEIEILQSQYLKSNQETESYSIFKTLKDFKQNDKKNLIKDVLKKEIIDRDLSQKNIGKILVKEKYSFIKSEFDKISIQKKENILKYLISNFSYNRDFEKFKELFFKSNTDYYQNEINPKKKFKTFKDLFFDQIFFIDFFKKNLSNEQLVLSFSKLSLIDSNNQFFLDFLRKNNVKIFNIERELVSLYKKLPFSNLSQKKFNLILRYWTLKFIGSKKTNLISQEFLLTLLMEMEKDFLLNIKSLKSYINYSENQDLKKSIYVFIEKNNFIGLSKSEKEKREIIVLIKILLKNKEYKYLKDILNSDDIIYKIIPQLKNESLIEKLIEEEIININQKTKLKYKRKKSSEQNEKLDLNFKDLIYFVEFGSVIIKKEKIYEKDFLKIIRNMFKNNFFLLKKYVHSWSKNQFKISRFIKILEATNGLNIIKPLIHVNFESYLKIFDSLIKKINLDITKLIIDKKLNLKYLDILKKQNKLFSYFLLKIWSRNNLIVESPSIFVKKIILNILKENQIDIENLYKSLEKINNTNDKLERNILNDFIKILNEKNYIKKKRKIKDSSEELISNDLEDGVTVFNSGLVLIWQYLYALFSKLGYVSEEKYINDLSKNKAIISTIFLVTGRTKVKNENLLLNKILCGIDYDFLVDSSIELNEFEIETCNLALKSVINRWEKIKNINDLRRWFLQREGLIIEKKDEFNLIVKNKPQDALIKFIPWGFMMIKSKIMKKRITINWRY